MTAGFHDRRIRSLVYVLLTAAAYFGSARLGYVFAIPGGIVTLWPPSGVMLALFALSAKERWPALAIGGVIGSMGSDLLSGYSPALGFAAAAANILESVVAAAILQWHFRGGVQLRSVRAVLAFAFLAVVASNALTALVGGSMLHAGFGSTLGRGWFVWWAGDGLGMLLVAPLVIALSTGPVVQERARRGMTVEALVLIALLFLTARATLGVPQHWFIEPPPYVVFPLLFWAAIRFGVLGASLGCLIVAAVATWNAALGLGPFIGAHPLELSAAFQTYEFLSVAALSSLGAAAAVEERLTVNAQMIAIEQRFRESEQRMQFALDAVGGGAWDRDFDSGLARWSPSQERLHGLPAGGFGGTRESFLALVHPDDRASVTETIATSVRHRTDAHVLYRSVWPDGTTHWISSIGRTNYDGDRAVSATGISFDVTERRKLEDQFRQSQKMETVGQLAGGVAHDFNNMLMAIQGFSAFVLEELPADSPSRADLAEIVLATKRAAALTRQLLTFSRRQQLSPVVLNLVACVHSIEPMITWLIGEHIEVVVQVTGAAGHVRADPGQIEQVILNLALNARDAMPDGGVLLMELRNVDGEAMRSEPRFSSWADAPDAGCILLEVTDTGTGMDAATLARVFEPFFTTKPSGEGTGLGLATVHGIVNQSGGRVWVSSVPGRGTTFSVCLPRVDETAELVVAGSAKDDRRFSDTILLVEDNTALRTILQRQLEARGYAVLVAGSPHEALALSGARPEPVQLLLTDVVLPGMSGRALAETLAKSRPGLRTLFMSGYSDTDLLRQGVLSADMHFIQKPCAAETLLRQIRTVLASDA